MAWITDSLSAAFTAASRLNPFGRGTATATALPGVFTHQLAIAAYMASGMMRKVIAIPAEDRVREWRDWQAEAKIIEAIEAEEKRLGLVAKVQEAETLRGIGGGAIIIVATGGHDQELRPEQIAAKGIVALNVVSRWQITPKEFDKDLASPNYGWPAMFEIDGGNGQRTRIHPSRVICFRGARLPAGSAVSDEEAFWGDSRLLRVYNEVSRSDQTQAWFAALVRKAKLLRFGVPGLETYDQEKLNKRIALIAEGESSLNATLYRSSGGTEDPGEEIKDYQVSWNGIPAMMDAFDQRVAAVSDIPFTRLMGRSPAGMNATGQHDMDNWNKAVVSGQKLETRPCLEQLDQFLLRSAGADPAKVTWKFAPLSVPSEKEEADTLFTTTQALEKLQAIGAIPDEAFAKAVQNLMVEREYFPGLDQALAEIPEAERYGLNPEDDGTDDDPSALQAGKEGDPASAGSGGSGSRAARRAVSDGGAPTGGHPFDDARRVSKGQRLARKEAATGFDPSQPRDRHGRWIPTGVRDLMGRASAGDTTGKAMRIGSVGERAEKLGVKAGVVMAGKSVSLDPSLTRHLIIRHGNETRKGQKSVRAGDIAAAATLLNGARLMRRVRSAKNGAPRIAAITHAKGERIYSVFEQRKYTVVLVTMWKR